MNFIEISQALKMCGEINLTSVGILSETMASHMNPVFVSQLASFHFPGLSLNPYIWTQYS